MRQEIESEELIVQDDAEGGGGLQHLEDTARRQLGEFVAKLKADHPDNKAIANAETMLVTGLPVDRILEIVKGSDPLMLVVGSTGRTGLGRLLIGSKAEQLVRLSPVPVLVVR